MESNDFPEYAEWSIVAIKLLQGVLYSDENISDWSLLLKFQNELQTYFARIALILVVNDSEGYAYLRQIEDGDTIAENKSEGEKYQNLPRLFRRSPLSYDATMLCILLRQRLHEFDERLSNLDDERCAFEETELFDDWKKMVSNMPDEKKSKSLFDRAMNRLKEIQFIKQVGETVGQWEIRRILKARIPLENLEHICRQLQESANVSTQTTGEKEND
jgi:hypothetical protein